LRGLLAVRAGRAVGVAAGHGEEPHVCRHDGATYSADRRRHLDGGRVEHVDELIPAHAIRALDVDDERIVEAHLAVCERCRLQLTEFESVAASLAYAAPPAAPPADLRSRILTAVEPVVE